MQQAAQQYKLKGEFHNFFLTSCLYIWDCVIQYSILAVLNVDQLTTNSPVQSPHRVYVLTVPSVLARVQKQRVRQNPCLLQNQELQNDSGYQESFLNELQVLCFPTCVLFAPSNSSSNNYPNVGLFRTVLFCKLPDNNPHREEIWGLFTDHSGWPKPLCGSVNLW